MWLGVAADFARLAGASVYGGGLLLFAFLLWLGPRWAGLDPVELDRVYRASGPISGLALGLLILGGALHHYLVHGAFVWGSSGPDGLELARDLLFGALWVSYTWREVWTLEPLRRLDPRGGPLQREAYLRARPAVVRHVGINALLFTAVLVLSVLESALRGGAGG